MSEGIQGPSLNEDSFKASRYPIEMAKQPVVNYSISVDVYQRRVFVKIDDPDGTGKWIAISMSPEEALGLVNSLTLAVMEAKL